MASRTRTVSVRVQAVAVKDATSVVDDGGVGWKGISNWESVIVASRGIEGSESWDVRDAYEVACLVAVVLV
ncbi:unnamed protein product [Sphenostylis stenocarpa]|uniref:Uncharacterized protein n=1 Tax=Sphenostylis stenocarpa TaxID=92480 RepID=A0AA86W3M6_9FABA|nr:unnamed protein product [Sphenostylis stenocarpa]